MLDTRHRKSVEPARKSRDLVLARESSVGVPHREDKCTASSEIAGAGGLDVHYNHDLDVSEAFLRAHPTIREALKDARLCELFSYFDEQAKSHKRSFELFGLWSLILGLIPLMIAAFRMVIGEGAFTHVAEIYFVGELCGVASIFVVLWIRKKRHKVLWCQAVFCRERVRQWHFQKFLDGEFITLLVSRNEQYQEELDRRWGKLTQDLRDGYGMMVEFTKVASKRVDFFHEPTAYADPQIANEVCDAVWTLRFEHQLRYSRRKVESQGEQAGLNLHERTAISETIASLTLAGAILVSASAIFFSVVNYFGLGSGLPWAHLAVTRTLGGTALGLAVLSAASRAYRAGFTLPDESESYEEHCDRVRELEAVSMTLSRANDKIRILGYLEEEAAAELRRFLRMKMRATFVS